MLRGLLSFSSKTKVSRVPFFKPAEGEWIYLPVDKTHNMQVVEEDRDGNSLGSVNLYESKGWRHYRYMVDNEAAMALLPDNWQDVANRNAEPVFAAVAAEAPAPAPAKAGKQASGEF